MVTRDWAAHFGHEQEVAGEEVGPRVAEQI